MSTRQESDPGLTPRRVFSVLAATAGALVLAGCQVAAPPATSAPPAVTETVTVTETAAPAEPADGDTDDSDTGTDGSSETGSDVFDPDGSIEGAESVAEMFFTAVDEGDWVTVADKSGDPEIVSRIQNNSDIRDALTQYAGSPVTCVHRDDDRIQQTLSDAFTVIDDTYACTRVDVEPLDAEFWTFPTLFISVDSAGEMMIVYRTITYWD
ncbi:hypothetical protein [Pseudoclavibacter sp. RFBB5]|uniref:hypothetical protein n=1 Tax=Pseudoclavibacter sp. RFBB5 TaxID=2080574 RepID=UPI000CE80476|nr:hypothetical protein [Pseudoclavibacter sp. RFBB5]PPG27118.1 hypothetical protein C5B97_16955 [Pseudoclavibacter sp. RFBB5]